MIYYFLKKEVLQNSRNLTPSLSIQK